MCGASFCKNIKSAPANLSAGGMSKQGRLGGRLLFIVLFFNGRGLIRDHGNVHACLFGLTTIQHFAQNADHRGHALDVDFRCSGKPSVKMILQCHWTRIRADELDSPARSEISIFDFVRSDDHHVQKVIVDHFHGCRYVRNLDTHQIGETCVDHLLKPRNIPPVLENHHSLVVVLRPHLVTHGTLTISKLPRYPRGEGLT